MNVSSSQIKLATKLHKHNLANATRNPMKTVIDLPLSTEMIELLDNSLNTTDEEGYLSEAVGSHLSHPLSAMAVYCPAAAIMASKFSASRIPSPPRSASKSTKGIGSFLFGSNNNNESDVSEKQTSPTTHHLESSFNGNQSPAATMKTPTTRPKIDEARSRLDVLWLRRKAELAREDGDLTGAVNIIQEALDVHLGGRDYDNNTNLSRPVLSSDPRELLDTIQKDFFLFDSSAHSKAAVVQRWYHRKHTARCNSITLITKLFRGFRKRKVYNKYKEARRQCAVMLQRRFRKHLIRMHALATKLKKWYKLRKEVQEYHRKLRIYRMARRIQALFRGYRGRNKAGLKRLQFLLVRKIQRTARAYVMRRSRAWVLALFHQKFWQAARRIQTFVRKQQAVERSQMKLLIELSRESIRARKERIVVEEALRMQKIRNQYYFSTDAGRIHLQHVQRRAHVKQLSIKFAQAALSEEEVLTQKLIAVLEEYDADGTGNIPTRRLKKVLNRALIPVDKEQLMILKQRFDPEETGQIGFSDILDWYNSEAADDLVEPDSLSDRLAQMKLTLQRKLRGLPLKTQLHGARKVLNSEQAAWLSKETIGTFRLTHPPKYQCCQCRQAFVLFTDYYVHFDGDGNCGVLQQKGMFFPRYWVKQDWHRQRQIELEVMRVNDEHPYVMYQCTMQNCAHVAHLKHIDVKTATDDMIYKVTDIYREQISTVKKPDLKKHTVQSVKDLFAACECSSVTLFAAEAVVRALRLPVSKAWITDGLCPLNEMVKWLSKYLTDYADSDHSSFSDNSSSTKMSDFFKQDDPKTSRHHVEFSLQAMRPPTITDSGLMKRRARDLAEAQVLFLKALHVDTQTALFALLEFRSRKPRSITMTDDELQELGLISLTQEHYLTLQHELVSRLRRINEMYVAIYSRVPTPTCPTLRRLLFKSVPVGPSDDITGDGLFDLFLDTAHDVAQARLGCYLKSSIGAMVRRRLAADLKISKHRLLLSLVQDAAKSTKYADANSSKIISQMNVFGAEKSAAVKALDLQYLFGKYCSIFQDEGIDVRDVDLVAREFALMIPEADQRIVVDQLDPEGGGFIFFVYFLRWMRSENPALYQDFSAKLRQDVLRFLQAASRSKYYFHAADVLLARFRSVHRMEVTVREGILYSDDFRSDLYMHTLQVFYRRCEGGAVNEDLNARKYHILSHSTRGGGGGGGDMLLDEESLGDTGTLGHNSLVGLSPSAQPESGPAPAAPILSTSSSASPGKGATKHAQPDAVVADPGAEAGVDTAEEEEFGGEDDGSQAEGGPAAAAPLLPAKEFVRPTIMGGVYDNLTKWYTLRWREEESENRVIYSVVEQRAELQYWQNIVTPVGWYNLWTERKFLQQLDAMIDATGYCMVHRTNPLPRTAGGVPAATIQQALSIYGTSSVSSLASGSLQQYSAAVSHVLSVKDQDSTQLYDNASISSHTHSFAGDDDEHPFAYLDPGSVQGKGHADFGNSIGSGSPGDPLMPMSPAQGSVTGTAIDLGGGGESESDGLIQGGTINNSVLLEEEAAALSAHGRALYTAVLEMVVSVFDTDCTGDLDEGEVRVLLRCLRCALSEKAFRHTFADNDDVIRGVSVRKLINHLSERVHWDHRQVWKTATGQRQAGIGIAKRANIGCAAGILVSLQRQLAHKRALQSVKLSKIGRIVMLRESHAGSSDQTLLVRSQLFAMRQVSMFLRTTQGKIKLHHALQDLAYSWQRDVLNVAPQHAVATSGVYYLNYAYALHQEGDGVLATEIPHVVKFLVTKLRLATTRRVEELALMFTGLRGSTSDIRCLNHAEFTGLLAPVFLQPKSVEPNTFLRRLGLKGRLRRDAKLRMYSCARQQAVKISMDFPVIEVSETNYRCSVLGLRLFIQRSLPVVLFSKRGKTEVPAKDGAVPLKPVKDTTSTTDAAADAPDDASTAAGSVATTTAVMPVDCVPKEAVALHLLALGYSISDLSHPCLADLLDVDHLQGHMQLVPVSLAAAVDAARKGIAKTGTYLEAARRLRRKLIKYWRLHLEFKQVTRALTQYSAVVDKKGGEFLKEILAGVSHCLE